MIATATSVKPFQTVLDLGTSTPALAKKRNFVFALIGVMVDQNLMPMARGKIRETLSVTPHPGGDLISLIGEDEFFAFRQNRADLSIEEIKIPREKITGFGQWFAVQPIRQ